ncbi:MAG: hypothetical protein SCM96_02290 [Acidobacteriota bacterium]|nr:hypothetical protein [Acidobacteriota bacterium]
MMPVGQAEKSGAFFYRMIEDNLVDFGRHWEAARGVELSRQLLPDLPRDIQIQWIREATKAEAEVDRLFVQTLTALRSLSGRGGDLPELRYHKDESGFWGQVGTKSFLKGKILLLSSMPFKEIIPTVAHECRHLADYELFRPPYTVEEKNAWEKRAVEFSREVTARARAGERAS